MKLKAFIENGLAYIGKSVMDGNWKEEQHPRDEEGKFTNKGRGAGRKSKPPERIRQTVSQTNKFKTAFLGEHADNLDSITDDDRMGAKKTLVKNLSSTLDKNEAFLNYVWQQTNADNRINNKAEVNFDEFMADPEKVRVIVERTTSQLVKNWARTSADHDATALALQKLAADIFNTEHSDEHLAYTKAIPAEEINKLKVLENEQIEKVRALEIRLDEYFETELLRHKTKTPEQEAKVMAMHKENRDLRTALMEIKSKIEKAEEANKLIRRMEFEERNNKEGYKAFLQAQYDQTQQYLKDNGIESVFVYRGFRDDNRVGGADTEYIDSVVKMQPLSSFSTSYDVAYGFSGSGYSPQSWGVEGLEDDTVYGLSAVVFAEVPADKIFSTARTGFGCLNEAEIVVLAHDMEGKVLYGNIPDGEMDYLEMIEEDELIAQFEEEEAERERLEEEQSQKEQMKKSMMHSIINSLNPSLLPEINKREQILSDVQEELYNINQRLMKSPSSLTPELGKKIDQLYKQSQALEHELLTLQKEYDKEYYKLSNLSYEDVDKKHKEIASGKKSGYNGCGRMERAGAPPR